MLDFTEKRVSLRRKNNHNFKLMATVTLTYDARNTLIRQLIDVMLTAGAKIVGTQEKTTSEKGEILTEYQRMFGKRKNNKYTYNEIFVYNSQRNLAKILEHYED
jgi:hypothetical protein